MSMRVQCVDIYAGSGWGQCGERCKCVCVCGKEGTRCSCALKYIADEEVLSSSLSAELSSEPQARSFRRWKKEWVHLLCKQVFFTVQTWWGHAAVYIQVCAENAESTNKCSCSSTTPMVKPPEKALIAVVFRKIFLLHVRDCSGPVGTGVSLSNASCTRLDLLRDQACVNGNNPFLMSSNSSPNWA